MYVLYHLIFSVPLLFLGYVNKNMALGVISYFSAIFIDIDHYIYYVVKTRSFSFKEAIVYFMRNKGPRPYIFHTVYFQIFLLILVKISYAFGYMYFSLIVLYLLFGSIYHIFLDVTYFVLLLLSPSLAYKVGLSRSTDEAYKNFKMKFFLI